MNFSFDSVDNDLMCSCRDHENEAEHAGREELDTEPRIRPASKLYKCNINLLKVKIKV